MKCVRLRKKPARKEIVLTKSENDSHIYLQKLAAFGEWKQ